MCVPRSLEVELTGNAVTLSCDGWLCSGKMKTSAKHGKKNINMLWALFSRHVKCRCLAYEPIVQYPFIQTQQYALSSVHVMWTLLTDTNCLGTPSPKVLCG